MQAGGRSIHPLHLRCETFQALYAFAAEEPDELSLDVHTVVTGFVDVAVPDGWMFVCSGGGTGLVPRAFLGPLATPPAFAAPPLFSAAAAAPAESAAAAAAAAREGTGRRGESRREAAVRLQAAARRYLVRRRLRRPSRPGTGRKLRGTGNRAGAHPREPAQLLGEPCKAAGKPTGGEALVHVVSDEISVLQ